MSNGVELGKVCEVAGRVGAGRTHTRFLFTFLIPDGPIRIQTYDFHLLNRATPGGLASIIINKCVYMYRLTILRRP